MTPALSVVIPTIGRSTLSRLLDSLDAQPQAELLEVVVVADTHGGVTPDLEQARLHVLEERDARRYVWREYDAGMHCWGHPQRMLGGRCARAPWVWYSQDDNIAAQGALEDIFRAIARQRFVRPLFFRWLSGWREVIWRDHHLILGNIDADCLVLPRRIAERVQWGLRYEGDFDAAIDVMRLADEVVEWQDHVISISNPDAEHCWWLPQLVREATG